MKKVCILFGIIFLIIAAPLFAVDFIIGAKTGYYIWEPYLDEIPNSGIDGVDRGDGLLYGPVASSSLTDNLSISISALFGMQSKHWTDTENTVDFGGSESLTSGTYYADMKRRDIDFAISYRIFKQFKFIAGYKYQHIEMTFKETALINGPTYYNVRHHHVLVNIPSHGPAFGFGYAHTFSEIFFASVNLTGLYMWSKFEIDENDIVFYEPDGTVFQKNPDPQEDVSFDTRQVGFNLEPSFGSVIQNNLIFVIGLRYQMLKTKFVDKFVVGTNDLTPGGWVTDSIYGAFVSVMYVF